MMSSSSRIVFVTVLFDLENTVSDTRLRHADLERHGEALNRL